MLTYVHYLLMFIIQCIVFFIVVLCCCCLLFLCNHSEGCNSLKLTRKYDALYDYFLIQIHAVVLMRNTFSSRHSKLFSKPICLIIGCWLHHSLKIHAYYDLEWSRGFKSHIYWKVILGWSSYGWPILIKCNFFFRRFCSGQPFCVPFRLRALSVIFFPFIIQYSFYDVTPIFILKVNKKLPFKLNQPLY